MNKTHVFHLEDHDVIIKGTSTMLSDRADIIYQGVAKPNELYLLLKAHEGSSILLLDLNLYGEANKGEEVLEKVKQDFPACKVIILSGNLDSGSLIMDLAIKGANGFAVKSISASRLYELIKSVEQSPSGNVIITPPESRKNEQTIVELTQEINVPTKKTKYASLSQNEKIIFKLACWGLETEDIAILLSMGTRNIESIFLKIKDKLNYPRKSFHIFANFIRVDYEDFSEISEDLNRLFFNLLQASDIEAVYKQQTNRPALEENITNFLHTIQTKYTFLKNRT